MTGELLQFHLPCTFSEHRACQIVAHLSVWNEVLFHARLQLREREGPHGHQLSLVSFNQPQMLEPRNDDWLHRATTLACWLLKTHRCIAVVDLCAASVDACEALVYNTRWDHSFIKILKLNIDKFRNQRDLGEAISTMVHLEELECTGHAGVSASVLAALRTLVASTSSLSTLFVHGRPHEWQSLHQLLSAIEANATLRQLSLRGAEAYPRAYTDFPSANHSLSTLIVGAQGQGSSAGLMNLLHGLLKNRTITEARLEFFAINSQCGELILKVAANNQVLRSFEVKAYGSKVEPQPDAVCDRWLVEVSKNETLEQLFLPSGIFPSEQWEALFVLLSTSSVLKMVTIQITGSAFLSQVCKALTESGAHEKVRFYPCASPENADVLRCQAVSMVEAAGGIYRLTTVVPVLASCTHITSVRLLLERNDLNDDLSSAIAAYICGSTTLRQLHVTSYESRSNTAWGVVIDSLLKNRSIRELALDASSMCLEDVKCLADAVKSSSTISTVSFKTRWLRRLEAFLHALAADIGANYKLLCVAVNGPLQGAVVKDWFNIWDTTRRNSGLVARAARFVSGAPCGR
ncbi:hypothetical protein HPB48_018933 [Haemaphysalis longicornis]|uniref:Uncharacterized protein n=2 Tax=Haemaphysalis longicornis TaxID=44386 RepID=A0A9J6FRR1_HAELO|nr:hypothetical protein HPB48_018933 [Haemaphysalis longicornis]